MVPGPQKYSSMIDWPSKDKKNGRNSLKKITKGIVFSIYH